MKPPREHATNNRQTYFVSSTTAERKRFFHIDRWARLFLEVLFHYRESGYLLHEFVLMPDHFHLLITPKISLERAVQYVKGGYSRRAKLEFQYSSEVWQRGFSDHRIRDAQEHQNHRSYIYLNPVREKLVSKPDDYPYSSVAGFSLDPIPQWLKPLSSRDGSGTAEAVPFQGKPQSASGQSKGASLGKAN